MKSINATPMMTGWVGADWEAEPVSWVREYGDAKIFYTSLGDPNDFEIPAFKRLLLNAIEWGAGGDSEF